MKMFRLLFALTIICGVIYPLTVTVIGQSFFSSSAKGSMLKVGGKMIGSKLLGQKFTKNEFFHPRPSAADYATIPSGASQSSPTQKTWIELFKSRRNQSPLGGADAWTASGSGLDPHISPQNAYAQSQRVAVARGVSLESVKSLIDRHIEGATFGIWGQPRVNVLLLNLALMRIEGNNADTR